jgi:recombination protein RecT
MSTTTAEKPAAQNVAQLPSKASFKKLSECKSLAEAFETKDLRDRIAAAAPKHLDPDTMLRTLIQACGKTPLIYKCDFRQALGAFMSLTFLGLRPGTILGHAHLIPFAKTKWNPKTKKRDPDGYDLQVIIGYEGYEALAYQSGFVKDLQTGIYLPGDDWRECAGTRKELYHSRNLDIDQSSATPKAAYACASMINEGSVYEVMPWTDVLKIRNRSQAYRTALAAKEHAEKEGWRIPLTWSEAPWVRDERQMGRKSVIRRIAHYLPMCPELRAGVAIEDAQDAGKSLDFGPVIDGVASPMDGIPEATEQGEQQGDGDPGASFGVRDGQTEQTTQSDQKAETVKPNTAAKTEQQRQPDKASASQEFEAILIDAFGEVASEPFTDPAQFARSLLAMWQDTADEHRAALLEFNEGSIAEAQDNPAAAKLLAQLTEPQGQTNAPPRSDKPAFAFQPIAVPADRGGKPAWPTWVRALRDDLERGPEPLAAWIEAQRGNIEACPIAQRMLAIKAINGAAVATNAALPQWLIEAMSSKPKPPANQQQPTTATSDPDEKFATDQIAELRRIEKIEPPAAARTAYDANAKSAAVRTVMIRLSKDKRPLFDRIDAVFLEVLNTIDARLNPEDDPNTGEDEGRP